MVKMNIYKSIEEVPVWKTAHKFTISIYKITSTFPKSETFGLASQLRRSSSSIPANISEGFYRHTTKELLQFLYNARGSLGETQYHLLLANELEYISDTEYDQLKTISEEISKQLNGWMKSLKSKL